MTGPDKGMSPLCGGLFMAGPNPSLECKARQDEEEGRSSLCWRSHKQSGVCVRVRLEGKGGMPDFRPNNQGILSAVYLQTENAIPTMN